VPRMGLVPDDLNAREGRSGVSRIFDDSAGELVSPLGSLRGLPSSLQRSPRLFPPVASVLPASRLVLCKSAALLQKSSGSLPAQRALPVPLQAACGGEASLLYCSGPLSSWHWNSLSHSTPTTEISRQARIGARGRKCFGDAGRAAMRCRAHRCWAGNIKEGCQPCDSADESRMDARLVEPPGGPLQLRQPGGAIRSMLEQYHAREKAPGDRRKEEYHARNQAPGDRRRAARRPA
jgi:hypothetical protein